MTRRPQGAGSVYELKPGKWIAQLDLGRTKDGKRNRISRSAPTKKQAQAKLLELQQAVSQNELNNDATSQETLREYLQRWFQHTKPRWQPRTIELYEHQLNAHIIPILGNIPLVELKPLHVQEFMTTVINKGYVPTANKCRRMLYTALKQAVRWEIIDKNPVEAIDAVPEHRPDLKLWTPTEAQRFIDYHRNHRFFTAFYVLITAGLRRGELLGLRWEDVDNAGIYIRQTVTVVRNAPTIGTPKTRKSNRYVTLPPDTIALVEQHRRAQLEAQNLIGHWEHPELVFPSEIGTVMDPRNFGRTWTKAIKDAGLPHARIHDMRHLHISLQIQLGEDAKVISDRAGHSSTSFTLDRYGHIFDEQRRRAAHSLDTLLHGTATPKPTTSEGSESDT